MILRVLLDTANLSQEERLLLDCADRSFWFLPERFTSKVLVTSTCWLWSRAKNKKGYGLYKGAGTCLAHRFVWETLFGLVAEPWTVDHICEGKSCVRPTHLRLLTRGENSLRKVIRDGYFLRCGHPYEGRPCRPCENAYYRGVYASSEHDRETRKRRASESYYRRLSSRSVSSLDRRHADQSVHATT